MKFTVNLWGDEAVEFELDQIPVMSLDGSVLSERIVSYLIQYGARQSIRDAAAAEKDESKRNVLARKRIDALVNDTLREGFGGGAKLSPAEREARAIAEREVRAAFENPANSGWVAEQRKATGLSMSDLRDAAAKAHLEANKARIMAEAEANLAKAPAIELPSIKVA